MLQLPLLNPISFLAATSFHTLYGARDEDWLTKIVNKLFNYLPAALKSGLCAAHGRCQAGIADWTVLRQDQASSR
jgi:hypothetical protein